MFTDTIDPAARGQVRALCDCPHLAGSTIRIMPDVHAGAGVAIGTTLTYSDSIVPGLVGLDIGCGVETVVLAGTRLELPRLDAVVRSVVPAGAAVRTTPHRYASRLDLDDLRCDVDVDRAGLSLGTLGGGNHFVEVDVDDDGTLYLLVHSGSRNLGAQVARHYQQRGYDELGGRGGTDVPYELAYVTGQTLEDYLHDTAIAQQFADLNRRAIADDIVKKMHLRVADRISTVHNYVDVERQIVRKGAVSAREGEQIVVPINMRDGALVCTGLGNPEWNYSAPHGAGRLMSRSEVKQHYTVSAYKKAMAGVFSSTVDAGTLDECPMAYKDLDAIVSHIGPTARVDRRIRTVYNFKASADPDRSPRRPSRVSLRQEPRRIRR
ncbi:MAG: RtcB family protein [Micrococcales bacterium]|nr:RtcB family protein [Micrococcales bacterium]